MCLVCSTEKCRVAVGELFINAELKAHELKEKDELHTSFLVTEECQTHIKALQSALDYFELHSEIQNLTDH